MNFNIVFVSILNLYYYLDGLSKRLHSFFILYTIITFKKRKKSS